MAYTFTVTPAAPGCWEVLINFTAASPGDFAVITGLPSSGVVRRVAGEVLSGTATVNNPRITRTTPPSAADISDVVVQVLDPADATNPVDVVGYAPYLATTLTAGAGTLYVDPQIDAGADNAVEVLFEVTGPGGWG